MNKNTGVIALVLAVLAMAGVMYFKDAPVQSEPVGSFGGPELNNRVVTYGGFSQGGIFTIATTASAMTLTNADLRGAATIRVTPMGAGQAALALTLPASTTWPSLNKPGEVQSWVIDNDGLAAATTTTITAGTGVDIDGPTANDDVLNGDVSGELKCWRLASTGNIRCIVKEMVDAG